MSIDAKLARKSYPERIETNNKIELENGDYEIHIHDVWVRYVDIDGKYTKNREDASEQRCKFTITLDGTQPVIALEMDIPIRISKNSFYSKVIEKMTGITDRDEHLNFDPKGLVGREGLASIICESKIRKSPPHDEYPWCKVTEIRPRQVQVKRPQPARPAAKPAPNPAQAPYNFSDDEEIPF